MRDPDLRRAFPEALLARQDHSIETPQSIITGHRRAKKEKGHQVALRLDLTVYDVAYLELALRHGIPLAPLDRDLRAKARTLGVEVIG